MAPDEVRFAFLVLEDHPYGREMLSQLVRAGFVPQLVIEERSRVAEVEREKFLQRMRGFSIAPPVDTLLAGRDTQRVLVENHNDVACGEHLTALAPDLIVLGGTRILKPHVFAPARVGTLNSHPGLLPEVRGSASVAWAIALDRRVGCTCHFIEAGIDTGPIVGRRAIEVRRGDTYEHLCHTTTVLSGTLMTEALQAYASDDLQSTPQAAGDAAKRNMDDEGVRAVREKLAAGTYAHLVD